MNINNIIKSLIIILIFTQNFLIASSQDKIKNLYKKSLTFNKNNIPLINIGIAETNKNMKALLLKDLKLNNIIMKKGEEISIEYKVKNKGEFSLWLIFDKYPYNITPNLSNYNKYIKELSQKSQNNEKNRKLELVNVGNLSAINGNIIDIRKQLVIFGPFKDEIEAKKVKQKLYIDLRLKTEFYAKINKYPSSIISIKHKGRVVKNYNDILELDASLIKLLNLNWGFIKKRKINLSARAKLIFTVNLKQELTVLNRIDIETLLKGIVPAEIFASAPKQALKAQAVAARSDILAKIGTRHFIDPFDICGN